MAISQERLNLLKSARGEMFRDDVTPPIEKIAGLFPRGYISVVASMPGAGKTWLMQYIACQLSVGGTILDGILPRSPKYKSLILAGETGKKLLDQRLASTNWGYEPTNIIVYEAHQWAKLGVPYMINTREGQETIAATVEIERPTIMWLDTFLSFHTAEESKMADMTAVYQFMLRMASYYNMAVVLNHHMRKRPSNQSEGRRRYTQDDVIGSSAGIRLANAVYAVSVEELDAGKTKQTVTNVKSWDKKIPPFTYEFVEDEDGKLDFKIGFDTEGNNLFWSLRERLNAYIRDMASGAIIQLSDVSKYLHMNADTVRMYLDDATKGTTATLAKTSFMGKNAYRVL